MNATQQQRRKIMKHKAIFSLHACIFALSLRPEKELRRKEGAQNVTILEKARHGSILVPRNPLDIEPDAFGASERVGLMRGTGATLRSGRVSVLARRMVVPIDKGGRVVGTGTSLVVKVGCAKRVVIVALSRDRLNACGDVQTRSGGRKDGRRKEGPEQPAVATA